jgi:hypothetical protein
MTMLNQTLPSPAVIAIRSSVHRTSLTKQAQYEIERLTDSLFFRKNSLHFRLVLMVDLGGNTSSLWVATGVASVLGATLPSMVHVLAIGSNASESPAEEEGRELNPLCGSCILEYVPNPTSTADGMNYLTDRLSAIRAEGFTTIVHLSQLRDQSINLPRIDFVDGVVLLVRAAETRRAALEAIGRQLAKAGIPLLGSVLLDRVYPIPERLYRLL